MMSSNRFFSLNKKIVLGLFSCIFLICLPRFHANANANANTGDQEPARLLVHLLDYLANDYAGAVSEKGEVLSAGEFDEQVEFAKTASATADVTSAIANDAKTKSDLKKLEDLIQKKSPPSQVIPLARDLQKRVLELSELKLSPAVWPDRRAGQKLYVTNCQSCHGVNGRGDGTAAAGLEPPAANFWDEDRMPNLSPFQAFNTIRLGVTGTGMASYAHLSDEDTWNLAFYIIGLRHEDQKDTALQAKDMTLEQVATHSDAALMAMMAGTDVQKTEKLRSLRLHQPTENRNPYLVLASSQLDLALKSYRAGQLEEARGAALRAYLEGVEPIEPRLRANDPQLLAELEAQMSRLRAQIEARQPLALLQTSTEAAQNQLKQAQTAIAEQRLSPGVSFTAGFAILLREGFEAVLILLALLGVTRASGSRRASLWVHLGWISALIVGLLAWFAGSALIEMSGASRELLEGALSLFAVGVLLYVGFWLHRQAEIGRWKQFLAERVEQITSEKNLIGLAVISFVAVFREAFETVLFLKAIELEADTNSRAALYAGVLSAFAIVFLLSWLALRASRKLPLRTLFTTSSILMLALAFILTGKGIHAFQELGAIGVTAAAWPIKLEWLGIYPTLESSLAQSVALGAAAFIWWVGRRPVQNARNSAV